ncbi:MAG: NAD-dependent protein deacetylase [Paramuribaculum sp.]|nr:NAD-dependent protein deacetylase [Paramuribaculum sp.]
MTEKEKIDILREKINEADAIVVGGASGMSAASGFRWYYEDDDDYKEIAGGLREKYGDHNSFDLFYDHRLTPGEHWAVVLRSIKKIYDVPTGKTYMDLAELLEGKNYYIVTTNQDAQFFRVFPEERITRLQGDWRYFQVKSGLYDKLYYNKELVDKLLPEIKNDSLPEHLIPRSVDTGEELDGWVRSPRFLQGKDYEREFERYMNFLRFNMNKKVLFLELGVGMMTPMFIKEPFMNMTYQWRDAFYATINPKHAIIPKEIASKSIDIKEDIAVAIRQLLGKPTDDIKPLNGKIFDSARIY